MRLPANASQEMDLCRLVILLSAFMYEFVCSTNDTLRRSKRVVWIGVKYQRVTRIPATTYPTLATSTLSSPTYSKPHLCSADFQPDVIAQTADGSTYIFAKDTYWQIMDFAGNVIDNRQNPGSLITGDWPSLPRDLDAALTLSDGTTLFFKNERFHIFWNKMPRDPSTALISIVFPQIPVDKIEGAFVTNTSLIFFQGENFYVYGIEQFPFVQRGNVVDMGLPLLPVESAVNLSDGMAVVVMDKTAYQIDTLTLQVISSFPTQSLYGCLEPLMSNRAIAISPYGRRFDFEVGKDQRPFSPHAAFLYHLNLI